MGSKDSFAAFRITFPHTPSWTRHPLNGERTVPVTSAHPVLKGYLTLIAVHGKNNRVTSQLRDRLKTTSMGLGLVRLQMDVGLTEEASTTLASLQDDFQLMLHGVENPKEILPMNANRNFEKCDSFGWNEELLAGHCLEFSDKPFPTPCEPCPGRVMQR